MDLTHDNLQLAGLHIPDTGSGPFADMNEATAAGYDTLNPVTGVYQIGVVIEGAFVPIITEKASLIYDLIASKQAQVSSPSSDSASATGSSGMSAGNEPAVSTPPQG